jgi:hypothetical protein
VWLDFLTDFGRNAMAGMVEVVSCVQLLCISVLPHCLAKTGVTFPKRDYMPPQRASALSNPTWSIWIERQML